jgi:hypothetical protein
MKKRPKTNQKLARKKKRVLTKKKSLVRKLRKARSR